MGALVCSLVLEALIRGGRGLWQICLGDSPFQKCLTLAPIAFGAHLRCLTSFLLSNLEGACLLTSDEFH